MRRAMVQPLAAVGGLLLLTSPHFFELYRTMAFRTVPYDDYAPYLLALVGHGGTVPGSPMVYRVLSVAAAIPLYFVLPLYRFSKLEAVDTETLRSAQALAMVSYLATIGVVIVVYRSARRHLGTSIPAAALSALIAYLCLQFVSGVGVDPLAVLFVALLLYHLEDARIFVPLVLVAAAVNEKIVFVWVLFFGLRLLFDRPGLRNLKLQAAASFASVAGLVVAVAVIGAAGNEAQQDPRQYLGNIVDSVRTSFGAKGAYLNGSALAVLATVCLCAWLFHDREPDIRHRPIDVGVAVGMALVGSIFDVEGARGWSTGRIAMHAVPLYLPLVAVSADGLLRSHRRSRPPGPSTEVSGRRAFPRRTKIARGV